MKLKFGGVRVRHASRIDEETGHTQAHVFFYFIYVLVTRIATFGRFYHVTLK